MECSGLGRLWDLMWVVGAHSSAISAHNTVTVIPIMRPTEPERQWQPFTPSPLVSNQQPSDGSSSEQLTNTSVIKKKKKLIELDSI